MREEFVQAMTEAGREMAEAARRQRAEFAEYAHEAARRLKEVTAAR